MTKKKQEVNKITDKELELVQDQQRNLNNWGFHLRKN